MKTITIVLPFYNEEKNLSILLDELKVALLDLPESISVKVVFVNDASTDEGAIFIKEKIKNLEKFDLINLKKRSGQTGAFKASFNKCDTDYIIRMDSDLQDSPSDLNLFFTKILKEEPDLIMGIRVNRQHSKIITFFGTIYDLIIKYLFKSPLYTNSASFVAFKTKYVKNIPWKKNDHRYLPLIVIKRGATKITHVMVYHRKREHGKTKYPTASKVLFGPYEAIKFIMRLQAGEYNFENEK